MSISDLLLEFAMLLVSNISEGDGLLCSVTTHYNYLLTYFSAWKDDSIIHIYILISLFPLLPQYIFLSICNYIVIILYTWEYSWIPA